MYDTSDSLNASTEDLFDTLMEVLAVDIGDQERFVTEEKARMAKETLKICIDDEYLAEIEAE